MEELDYKIFSKPIDRQVGILALHAGNGIKIVTNSDSSQTISADVADINIDLFEIVSALPVAGESNLIYLVPSKTTPGNMFEEYIWVNNEWELLGAVSIDLTGYVKRVSLSFDESMPLPAYWVGVSNSNADTIMNVNLTQADPLRVVVIEQETDNVLQTVIIENNTGIQVDVVFSTASLQLVGDDDTITLEQNQIIECSFLSSKGCLFFLNSLSMKKIYQPWK